MDDTDSLIKLFQLIRARILSVATALGTADTGRLYYGSAPQGATYPYAVARLINQQFSMGQTRLRADLEIMLFDRPDSRQLAAENLADLIQGSLIGYRASGVMVMANPMQRDTLPRWTDPADATVVQIRLVAEIIAYPAYLTQYATPLNS